MLCRSQVARCRHGLVHGEQVVRLLSWGEDARLQTIGESETREGTVVGFEVDPNTERNLRAIFDEYIDDETLAFDKSRTTVRLFEFDVPFVSRARNLERFREVVVDFRGVKEVGQGFADELFRVWVGDHPETNLVPVNMNRAVKLIVDRALADANSKPQ